MHANRKEGRDWDVGSNDFTGKLDLSPDALTLLNTLYPTVVSSPTTSQAADTIYGSRQIHPLHPLLLQEQGL